MLEQIAENINILGRFCGVRDIPRLTRECMAERFGIPQADVMVLFGGSILCGGDVLAEAMKNGAAKKYVIAGGEGHTTEALRAMAQGVFPDMDFRGLPEAKVFAAYIKRKYGLEADFLECRSTNCGNNITYLLELLRENRTPFKSIILTQDASMQRRMAAGLEKYVPDDVAVINFAAYSAEAAVKNARLVFENDIFGMWDMERYITLLMGEIPRLSDDGNGYGPNGKNFIAHVDIPAEVRAAFAALSQQYPALIREANPLYASASK